ncbi:MAG TPA: hypothetical protein PK562_04580, partial [Candidatus Omnitrophota bacterium]|nr:hypothetical protein [Candidatus Omnitrophota bacterium]
MSFYSPELYIFYYSIKDDQEQLRGGLRCRGATGDVAYYADIRPGLMILIMDGSDPELHGKPPVVEIKQDKPVSRVFEGT